MVYFTLNYACHLADRVWKCIIMSSADRVSLFSSESPSFLAIWSLFLKILVGAYEMLRLYSPCSTVHAAAAVAMTVNGPLTHTQSKKNAIMHHLVQSYSPDQVSRAVATG